MKQLTLIVLASIFALSTPTITMAKPNTKLHIAKKRDIKQNITAGCLEGTWKLDMSLTKRLGGLQRVLKVTFKADRKTLLGKLPNKYSRFFAKRKIYLIGTLQFTVKRLKGKRIYQYPFLLTTHKGNPHVFYFRPRGGHPLGDSESFNLSCIHGKTKKQDLLFLGGDYSNHPFAAYQRNK